MLREAMLNTLNDYISEVYHEHTDGKLRLTDEH